MSTTYRALYRYMQGRLKGELAMTFFALMTNKTMWAVAKSGAAWIGEYKVLRIEFDRVLVMETKFSVDSLPTEHYAFFHTWEDAHAYLVEGAKLAQQGAKLQHAAARRRLKEVAAMVRP